MTLDQLEHCPTPGWNVGAGTTHGVEYHDRSNRNGRPFEHARDDYQTGICNGCGQLVYSERRDGEFHNFRLRTIIIHEEEDFQWA